MPARRGMQYRLPAATIALGAAYLALTAMKSPLFGSKATGWVYPYLSPLDLNTVFAGLLCGLCAAWLAHLFARRGNTGGIVTPSIFFLFSSGACWLLASLRLFSTAEIFSSANANSFQTAARALSFKGILHFYPHFQAFFPGDRHVFTNMAGKTFFTKIMLAAPDWLAGSGLLPLLIASAGVFPLYYAAKKLYSAKSAVFACALYSVMPALIYFCPLLNCVTAFFFLLSLCLLAYAACGRSKTIAAFYGLSLYWIMFFDPVALAPLGLLSLAIPFSCRTGLKEFFKLAAVCLLCFAGAHAAVYCGLGYNVFNNYAVIAAVNRAWLDQTRQLRMAWLFRNPAEAAAGMGVGIMFLFFAAQVSDLRQVLKTGLRNSAPQFAPGLALTGAWAVMAVMGVGGAEAVRVWLFSGAAAILFAAARLAETPGALYAAIIVSALQAAFAARMVGFVIP
ncbi:MAG: hypothetical protein PHW69_08705 [Elusimicrobiaceae bacterium]|nr:hypothetical protein [Elusimicrobiaceae bacterium]